MRKLFAVLAVCGAATVQAVPVTASWVNPAQYTDGSPLAVTAIVGTDLECVAFTPTGGVSGPCTLPLLKALGAATTLSFEVAVPPGGGEFCFRAKTRVASGAISDYSARACKTFFAQAPRGPTALTIR